ncbi:MAG: hypothetical protein ACW97Z_16415 [Candidatus Hodarchaeales archaeon]
MPNKETDHNFHKIVVIGNPSDRLAPLLQSGLESPLTNGTESPSQDDISEIHEVEYKRFHFTFHFTYSNLALEVSDEGSEKKVEFYHEAAGAILVWDYENLDSMKQLKSWLKELKHFTSKSLPVLLLGIKSETEFMSLHLVRETARDLRLEFYETSISNPTLLDKLSDIFLQKLSQDSSDMEYLLKICVIGSVTPLKAEFIHTFVGYKNVQENLPTLGVDIRTNRFWIDEIQVKLIIVDTAGQEFFGKLRPSYYRGASAAIILFDKCSRETFAAVPNWLKEFQKYIQPPVPIAMVGLITKSNTSVQEIPTEEGQNLATHLKLAYFETKSTDQQQVRKVFTYLARKVIEAK